ncbi:hypothetical protein HanIR_Chr16g0830081 [Helianthus annuus]|nr:hypothetical protein HanIR_Chr16g0830081 [Helianthus annuus]
MQQKGFTLKPYLLLRLQIPESASNLKQFASFFHRLFAGGNYFKCLFFLRIFCFFLYALRASHRKHNIAFLGFK